MSFPANIDKHRLALLEMLEEAFRDPSKRSVLKTRGISMLPLLQDRDEIVIRAVAVEDVGVGDVIAYRTGDLLVVHRVVAVTGAGDALTFYEKGDNNMYLTAVEPARILGVVTEIDSSGRTLALRTARFRRLGWGVARYGLRAVRVYDLCRRFGRRIVRPGSALSVAVRRTLHGLLQAPIRIVLAVAKRVA